MTSQSEQVGDATQRDIRQAARDLAQAVGNPDAEQAVLDMAAAFGNLSLTTVIPTLTTTLDSAVARRDKDFLAHLDALAAQRQRESAEILTCLKGLQGGQDVLQKGFQEVGETLNGLETRLNDLDTRHGDQWGRVIRELGQVREWVDESRKHRQQMQEQINALEAGRLPEGERNKLIEEHKEGVQRITNVELRVSDLEKRFAELEARLGIGT